VKLMIVLDSLINLAPVVCDRPSIWTP
jgi:hypothetical protein